MGRSLPAHQARHSYERRKPDKRSLRVEETSGWGEPKGMPSGKGKDPLILGENPFKKERRQFTKKSEKRSLGKKEGPLVNKKVTTLGKRPPDPHDQVGFCHVEKRRCLLRKKQRKAGQKKKLLNRPERREPIRKKSKGHKRSKGTKNRTLGM